MRNTLFSVLILLLFLSRSANSESEEAHRSSLQPHIHGQANLTLVMEGNDLEIQFESPSANLFGFGHKARTKKDISAVENAASLLGTHDALFLIAGGHCTPVNTAIDVSGVINSNHDDLEQQTKSDEYENEREHENNFTQHENHSEIIANYHYNCENMSELSSITVTLFGVFSGIHQIRAMWIKETRQGAVTLSTEDKIINLR